jgi:hypothetical protein
MRNVAPAGDPLGMFLVDRSLPGMTEDLLTEAHRLLQEAARRVSSPGRPVRFLRCTYLPDEGRCVCLFEASDELAVRRVNETAQVPFRRISSAMEFSAPGTEVAGTAGPDRAGRALEADPEA